jgi:His-Xaa-Ser system protein HxsD
MPYMFAGVILSIILCGHVLVLIWVRNMGFSNVQKDGEVYKIKLDPYVYPLEVVFSAAYVFLDKAYISVDRDNKNNILVEIKPKNDLDITDSFFNELIDYIEYKNNNDRNKDIKRAILQKALIIAADAPNLTAHTHEERPEEFSESEEIRLPWEDNDGKPEEENDFVDDPLGIAVPWEDKYGKE